MKLRLQITTPQGDSMTFEHPGPVVRVGRDAGCELALQGEASNSVSRRHACIELSPGGATVADTGSSNGTLLNDKPISKPAPLRRGDRVQLGYTGATLTVLELDLSAPPAPARSPSRARPWLIGAGVACAVLFFVGLLVWAHGRSRKPDAEVAESPPSPIPPTPPGEPRKEQPPPKPPPPLSPPRVKVIPVGSYYWRKEAPSVLLQRRGETETWRVLRPEEAVYTAHTLISLPGYESVVTLDRGLRVTLWGTLPEFARGFTGVPPFLLESAVMLNAPAEGIDLDLTLERGRVEIANTKARGEVAVRLRFLWEVWDVTLLDDKSRVCIELWGLPPEAGRRAPSLCLGLFTHGPVRLRAQRNSPFEFQGPSRVTWVSWENGSVRAKKLDQPPDWWVKHPKKTAEVNDVLLSLKDWSVLFDRLDSAKDPIQMILKHVADPGDRKLGERTTRVLGLLFLAALDDRPSLLRFLEDEDPDYADIRGTAAHGLRAWLSRNADRSAELVRMVRNRGLPEDEAELIVRLLHFYPAKALESPETYQELIDGLNHANPAVRYLASWWLREGLAFRVPPKALAIPYNPAWEEKKRQQAVAQWKKVIPPRTVPPAPPRRGGAPGAASSSPREPGTNRATLRTSPRP